MHACCFARDHTYATVSLRTGPTVLLKHVHDAVSSIIYHSCTLMRLD